ncbi:MAG TPA: ABC transporter permease subunit [Gammaproteobacteria bacterium]|nr:ABC transporter permease subunit [Gammaproteobacteria bacterium]
MSFVRNTFMTAYRSRLYPNYWDVLALLFVITIILFFAWTAKQMATPYHLGQSIPITLDRHALPMYAARTVVRMLIAMLVSLIFTFVFGTWAAKSERAERIIIPMIDVLQSVPILGFLSVTVAGWIALFPGSMLGPECATIFVIFTSQAWNMALGFYQTVKAVPHEVEEAARMFHLSTWQRFWRIEVPYSMPGLLCNAMASMSAGWFFVVAAEAITVANQTILLPGMGSYIAVAIQQANMNAIFSAIVAMLIVIIAYDQLLFRPMVAWADKFKSQHQATEEVPESWVIDMFRRTRLMRNIGHYIERGFDAFVNTRLFHMKPKHRAHHSVVRLWNATPVWATVWDVSLFLLAFGSFLFAVVYTVHHIAFSEVWHVFVLGIITACRVFLLIAIASLVWVPIGIWIGMRPRVASFAQPIAQVLAAFPANLFYPLIVVFIVHYQLSANIWLTPLMILGVQWYILFNVIAGASVLPKDLLQAADNFGVVGWLRWSRLLLPGIFPYYITGAITASGGAWNASVVSEVASWGSHHLAATGLGAYISEATTAGDFSRTALGIGMMCTLVLIFNRLVWRPLYVYAENRFLLE